MRDSDDADDIWENVKPTTKKNVFDEDVSVEALKKGIKNFNDEDDAEIIGIEGNFVHYDLSSLATPVLAPASLRLTPAVPEPKYSFGSASKAANHVRSQSFTFAAPKSTSEAFPKVSMVPEKNTSSSSLSMSIEEVVNSGKKGPQDVEKMQQTIQILKKQLLTARRERWIKLPVEATLRRIMKGEAYSLEAYRALEDKLALLDQATALQDGNAITAAVLHLRHTVKKSIFSIELAKRPVAANHYLSYLRAHYEHAELVDTLVSLRRTEEASIVKYKVICNSGDVRNKVSMLKTCLRTHFEADSSMAGDAALVREHVDLLERQLPIEDSDARLEAEGRTKVFRDFPRRHSLLDMPLTTTLFYSCLYHHHELENSLSSPLSLKKRHEIPERQYIWTALSARAKAHAWADIENLLTAKSWFGGKKMKAPIGFDKVVEILNKFNAPTDILTKYLELVEDLDIRLSLSKKISNHKVTVETLVKLKDRAGVEDFAHKHGGTIEADYARRMLKDEAVRWK
ncbi:spermatogenesis-defective protein 39 homolog isoform X2 [Pomacea canaliculata]|uniref:spermatogenesis-defective protein 39 homolog isoform X2 n=1 Tax=Pomacea canaliculata TaxID=400727 RepID=UPI000D734B0E|nr:spermatogenesis-defective protein 39 homolog isoform X2 [Pomacea canaliculata]